MIELSCDLGEAAGENGRAVERELWTLIDAANVACGGHAGDDASMREAARIAAGRGIILGAHPSYPDRENFGRVSMKLDPRELRRALIHQLSTFATIAAKEDVAVQRVKAHGALYNDAHRDRELAELLAEVVKSIDESLAIVAGDTSEMALSARESGLHLPDPRSLRRLPRAVAPVATLELRQVYFARATNPLLNTCTSFDRRFWHPRERTLA